MTAWLFVYEGRFTEMRETNGTEKSLLDSVLSSLAVTPRLFLSAHMDCFVACIVVLYYGFDPLDLGAPLFSHFVLLISIYLPILKAYHLSFVFVCLQWNPYVFVDIYNGRRTPF